MRTLLNTQAHTFATLQKKLLLSTKLNEILTQAGPKKHVKKVLKKSFRRAWISACYIRVHFVKKQILIHGNSKRFWGGQMVNVHHSDLSVVYKTRVFSQKTKNLQKNVKNLKVGKSRMRAAKKDRPVECSGG